MILSHRSPDSGSFVQVLASEHGKISETICVVLAGVRFECFPLSNTHKTYGHCYVGSAELTYANMGRLAC